MRADKMIAGVFIIVAGSLIAGCGDGGGGAAVTPNVTGVGSIGAPLNGPATLKDAGGRPEQSTTIDGINGSFAFTTGDRQPPFILRASSLYSISGATGTANINPFSNLLVAEAGHFTTTTSLDQFYSSPDGGQLQNIFSSMSTARRTFHQKLDPLLSPYGLTDRDPISDPLVINEGYGQLFKDVRVSIDANGTVTMLNRNNLPVFTGPMGNLAEGTLTTANILPPSNTTGTGTVIGPVIFGANTGTGTTTTGTTGTITTTGTTTTGTSTTPTTTGTTTTINPTGTTTIGTTPTTTTTGTGTTVVPTITGTTTTINPTGTTTIGTTPTTTTTGTGTTVVPTITGTTTTINPTSTTTIGTTTIPTTTGTTTIGPTTTGTSTITPTTTITGTGTGTTSAGTGTTSSGTGTASPGTGTTGAGTSTTTPGTGTTSPGTGTISPGTSTINSGTGTASPGTGTTGTVILTVG